MAAREDLKRLVDELKMQRDELAVKVHLARQEARDEWETLEKKLEHLRARAQVVGKEAGDAAGDVGAAARQLVEELKKGYERVRRLV
jgi:SMC interacting uncharacterized protein involved in chromosome segregation